MHDLTLTMTDSIVQNTSGETTMNMSFGVYDYFHWLLLFYANFMPL